MTNKNSILAKDLLDKYDACAMGRILYSECSDKTYCGIFNYVLHCKNEIENFICPLSWIIAAYVTESNQIDLFYKALENITKEFYTSSYELVMIFGDSCDVFEEIFDNICEDYAPEVWKKLK